MASIIKRGKNISVVYMYRDSDGSTKQRWDKCESMKEAKKRKAQVEFQLSEGTFLPPSIMTVRDLLYDFVDVVGSRKWSVSTYGAKVGLIENYIAPHIGKMSLSETTPRVMDAFYKKLEKTKAVIRTHHRDEGTLVSAKNIQEIHKIMKCAFDHAITYDLIGKNPVEKATLPHHEPVKRAIWTIDVLRKASEVCDDLNLEVCMELSFACSMRLGEIVGLQWDRLEISDESIATDNASLFIDRTLQRVSKQAMEQINRRGILFEFPPIMAATKTALVLKKPKTVMSVRRVWIPTSLARKLRQLKFEQDEYKRTLGELYYDFNLVIALPNGRPCDIKVIDIAFVKLIKMHDLPRVVFHSLRHSSTTYKLKMNNGDMKAVQGDTGHAQLQMIADVYSHILDEDRRQNAMMMENAFYQNQNDGKNSAKRQDVSEQDIAAYLQGNPEIAQNLMTALLSALPISRFARPE